MLGVSIFIPFYDFLLCFGIVLKVWYFLFFIMLGHVCILISLGYHIYFIPPENHDGITIVCCFEIKDEHYVSQLMLGNGCSPCTGSEQIHQVLICINLRNRDYIILSLEFHICHKSFGILNNLRLLCRRIFASQGLRSALLIFTFGFVSRIFVIPAHCHLDSRL